MRLSGQEYVDKYATAAKEESKQAEQGRPPTGARPSRSGRRRRPDRRRPAGAGRGVEPHGRRRRTRCSARSAVLRFVVLRQRGRALCLRAATATTTPAPALLVMACWSLWTGFVVWAYADPRAGGRRCCWSRTWRSRSRRSPLTPYVKGDGLQRDPARLLGDGRRAGLGDPLALGGGLVAAVVRRRSPTSSIREEFTQTRLRQHLPARPRRRDRRLPVRAAAADGAASATAPSARRPPRPSGPRLARVGARRGAAGARAGAAPRRPSSVATAPSSAGWPASRRSRLRALVRSRTRCDAPATGGDRDLAAAARAPAADARGCTSPSPAPRSPLPAATRRRGRRRGASLPEQRAPPRRRRRRGLGAAGGARRPVGGLRARRRARASPRAGSRRPAAEGRLGVQQSILGRMRDLGGTATVRTGAGGHRVGARGARGHDATRP